MEKTLSIVFWSGGKDSVAALHTLVSERRYQQYEVVSLVTTIEAGSDCVPFHHASRAWMQAQADAIGIPIQFIETTDNYEQEVLAVLQQWKDSGVEAAVFGDIFLEDLRSYREQLLAKIGMQCVFPLWDMDTQWLVVQIVSWGYDCKVVCVNDEKVSKWCLGHKVEKEFLDSLPPHVDPCGEHGEYHTFVVNGPLFATPLRAKKKAIHEFSVSHAGEEQQFYYCELEAYG